MNAHIINCDKIDLFDKFKADGYLGVGFPKVEVREGKANVKTSGQLRNICKNAYGMFADMKRVFPGDMIFVHTEKRIYGVFKAKSHFKEDLSVDELYLSKNIHFYSVQNNQESGWQRYTNRELPQLRDYFRQVSISHFIDKDDRNICFEKGFSATEVFDLKRAGKIWSIPERWKYPDSARIVRPIMLDEAQELIKLLELQNLESDRIEMLPKKMDQMNDIQLVLNPKIVENEKIIEAWLNMSFKTKDLKDVFGTIDSFGNNVQVGYLKGIDIFGYRRTARGLTKYKVIEVKKDRILNGTSCLEQVSTYMDWVIMHLSEGNPKLVEGYIVARDFDKETIQFVKKHNAINSGRKISLVKFSYVEPCYATIELNKIDT